MPETFLDKLRSIGKGALVAAAGAVLTYLAAASGQIDWGPWTPVAVAALSVAANAIRKFFPDLKSKAEGAPEKPRLWTFE